MTRSEGPCGGALWRSRAVASIGVAAVIAAGGVATAISANAAPPAPPLPTLTLSAPTQIYNAGPNVPAQPVTIVVDNGAVGAMNVTSGTLTVSVSGVPAGVLCSNIALNPDVPNPLSPALPPDLPGQSGGTCTYSGMLTAPAGGPTVSSYQISANTISVAYPNGQSGTLVESASFQIPSTPPGNTDTVTSNSVTTTLAGPTPPTVKANPPAATIYRAYNFQVINPGLPLGTVTVTDTGPVNPGPVTATNCDPYQIGAGTANCFQLNDGLTYNSITGYIYRYTSMSGGYNPDLHPDTFRIVENNTSAGPPTANLGQATLTVVIPNLFSDVPATDQFATAIYALGASNILGGFADGTYRPTAPVSRQAFAHFVFQFLGGNDGSCSLNKASAFPDVPNTSQFCKSIRFMSSIGVVNGYTDGNFHPTAHISRQAVAAITYRFYNYFVTGQTDGVDAACSDPTGFYDVSASNQFCGDIEFLVAQGYAQGYADGGFHPTANTSRQAAAQILYNAISNVSPGYF